MSRGVWHRQTADKFDAEGVVEISPKELNGGVPAEQRVQKSFDFLLDRQSNTSIASSAPSTARDQSYFPEYESTIRTMLK